MQTHGNKFANTSAAYGYHATQITEKLTYHLLATQDLYPLNQLPLSVVTRMITALRWAV